MPSNKVDIIVIGSSPILMLYALRARQAGKSVILLEEAKSLGGAWSLDNYLISDQEMVHERACHLIEWYSGGYELIERITGIKFFPLKPQPIKLWSDGRHELYTSRSSIVFGFLSACRSFLYSIIKTILFYFGFKKYKKNKGGGNISNAFLRMIIEFRYRFIFIAKFQGIKTPEGGFANFINTLSDKLLNQGVDIENGRARELFLNKDGSGSIQVGDRKIHAASIVVGESTLFNNFKYNNFLYNNYYHVLLSLQASEITCRNPYIHFPDHSVFHRMTYVEDTIDENNIEITIFLLQLRLPLDDINNLKNDFDQINDLYPIVKSTDYFKILKTIKSKHLSSFDFSGWYNYDKKAPIVLKTIGDISRNMILMKNIFLKK